MFLPKFKRQLDVINIQSVSGGCINDCYQLKTAAGNFFLKLNNARTYPGMFEAEKKGLELMGATQAIKVPEVYETGEENDISFLLMEFIESGSENEQTMQQFGSNLAGLHKNSAISFGLGYDNYIGSLPQCNTQSATWHSFFVERRLLPQIKMARDKGLISSSTILDFEKLFPKINSLFPDEKPALLHGDMWSGNYLIDKNGAACLCDPAVYYGHREMDIAMTLLFGNFGSAFYEGYHEVYPLEKDWQQRVDLCNLYPLLVR